MERIVKLLALLMIFQTPLSFAAETGFANQILRYPTSAPAGTRPTYGSINLNSATAVGSTLLTVTNGGTGVNFNSARTSGFLKYDGSGTLVTVTPKAPTVQIFTTVTASGVYVPPAGVLYIKIKLVAGGGGGAGSTSNSGGNGQPSSFSSFITVNGGLGGITNSGAGGAGATLGTVTAPAVVIRNLVGTNGGTGINPGSNTENLAGGNGGNSFLQGAGVAVASAVGTNAGANTGSGGGGGSTGSSSTGGGGGSSGYVEAILSQPFSSSYPYVIGAKGTKGATSGGSLAGGDGGDGKLVVEEYYQ